MEDLVMVGSASHGRRSLGEGRLPRFFQPNHYTEKLHDARKEVHSKCRTLK